MFLDFFDLHEQPFGVTPDPAFLYPSQTHCEALDALTEGIQSGRGFLALIAEPGMGKTTLLYQVLEALRDKARTAFLFQTQCSSREFFQYLLSELGVDSTGMGLVPMHNKLNAMLFAEMLAGRRFVLIVDEAHNLDDTVLETIRLLSNFETTNTKLLQIVLAGQPQLGDKLRQKHLAQLLQRITVVKHLKPFSSEETACYVRHRLKVAGHRGDGLFEPQALQLITQRSQGIPRNINRICYQALMEAHAYGQRMVSEGIVDRALRKMEVASEPSAISKVEKAADCDDAERAAAVPPLTYKPLTKVRSRGWHLWAGVFLGALMWAGLAWPVPNRVAQVLRGQVTAGSLASPQGRAAAGDSSEISASAVQTEDVDFRLQMQGMGEADSGRAVEPGLSARGLSNVKAVQISSTANDARVVVILDDTIRYNSARISSPERIYFDLRNARLNSSVVQKMVPPEGGLVKWVRAAQNTDDVFGWFWMQAEQRLIRHNCFPILTAYSSRFTRKQTALGLAMQNRLLNSRVLPAFLRRLVPATRALRSLARWVSRSAG